MDTNIDLTFPIGGLDRSVSFQRQSPFYTPDCMNVQSVDVIDERGRGGSRPGLQRTHPSLTNPVNMLAEVAIARVEGDARTIIADQFDGSEFADNWEAALGGFPTMTDDYPAVGADDGQRGALLDQPDDLQTTRLAVAELFVTPYAFTYTGQTYGLLTAGVDASTFEHWELTLTGINYSLSRNDTVVATGSTTGALAGWFRAQWTGADIVIYWCGRQIYTAADHSVAGHRVGFSLLAPADDIAMARAFRYDYYSSDPGTGFRDELVCASGGNIHRELFPGVWEQVTSTYTVDDTNRLRAAAQLQRLYIADGDRVAGGETSTIAASVLSALDADSNPIDFTTLGLTTDMLVILTNGVGSTTGVYAISSIAAGGITLATDPNNGSASWRVVRSPKVYNPLTNTLAPWVATTGTYPAGCRLICRYRDRIVLAGDPISPHLWYMSRQGNALDFNYGASDLDAQRAVAGQSSDAGVIGDAITALIPHSDDYLIVGCSSSLWVIRGDPAYGGQIDALSRTVGVVGPDAWASAPDGSTWFVSPQGVYVVPPGAQGMPAPVSKQRLPREFYLFGDRDVRCAWDHAADGLRIFVGQSGGSGTNWLVKDGAFWPFQIPRAYEPSSLLSLPPRPILDGPLLLGGADGSVRRFEDAASTDDGTAFTSYATMGPLRITANEGRVGMVNTVRVITDDQSADVTVTVQTGNTAQDANDHSSFTVSANNARTARPRARGHSARIKLSSTDKWAYESVVVGLQRKGVRRP